MSKTREALEVAKKALEKLLPYTMYGAVGTHDIEQANKRAYVEIAIKLINKALAEPEQEPVAKQYKHSKTGEWCNFIDEKHYKDTLESGLFEIRSLYKSPQPREWQELSEELIEDCAKAIAKHMQWDWDDPITLGGNTPEDEKEHFRDLSRVVLSAALRAKNEVRYD